MSHGEGLPGLAQRAQQFQRLAEPFDVLVVGGGIYGAWTAYDAALRGLTVALIDAGDWGGGTSSASSKLIHGGLRYLEHGDFTLVRTALTERSRLLAIAPHRVQPLSFLLPLWRDAQRGPFLVGAGLTLYDLLAGRHTGFRRHHRLSRERMLERCPFLAREGLGTGFAYADAGEDDARLVLEVVGAAAAAGAVVLNHCQVRSLCASGASGAITGAQVQDVLPDAPPRELRITAKQTVLCAGPWLPDLVAGMGISLPVRRTKGVHLVMPPLPAPLTAEQALLLTAMEDGRVFFLIPWYGATLLGTTDTDWQGDPRQVAVLPEDVRYLLDAAAGRLPGLGWSARDIRASFAGVRTLQGQSGRSASSVTREWLLSRPRDGLWVPIGGKFTSARCDAGMLMDALARTIGCRRRSTTGERLLPRAPAGAFAPWLEDMTNRGCALGLDDLAARTLACRHGTATPQLLQRIAQEPGLGRRLHEDAPFLRVELEQAVTSEMACTLDDVLRRRVPIAITTRLDEAHIVEWANLLAPAFSWSPAAACAAAAAWWQLGRRTTGRPEGLDHAGSHSPA